jgi:diguanylate cyclase (GGDEF)-like protein
MSESDRTSLIPPPPGVDSWRAGRRAPGSRSGNRGYSSLPARPAGHHEAALEGLTGLDLTPEARAVLERLLDEFDSVHHQLDEALERERFLEEQADTHPFLPVLNRRALARKLNRLQARAGLAEMESTLVILHLGNAAEIRRRHGLALFERILAEVALTLNQDLRASDALGSLCDTDFGVLLALTSGPDALAKSLEMAGRIGGLNFAGGDESITLEVAFGLHVLQAGESPNETILAADRDLRRRRDEETLRR